MAPDTYPVHDDAPTALVVESFRGCNMRCRHCNVPWIGQAHESALGAMSLQVFEALRCLFPFVKAIGYDCMGEPTLNTHLPSFIREQKRRAPMSVARMTSNLLGVSRDLLHDLVDAGLNQLQVSIDGAREDVFRAHRLGSTLVHTTTMVCTALEVATELRRSDFEVVCCFVAKTDNVNELPDVLTLLAELGVSALYVNGLEAYDEANYARALWANSDGRRAARSAFEETARRNSQLAAPLVLRFPRLDPVRSGCDLPIGTMTVNYDGTVSPCFIAGMPTAVYGVGGVAMQRRPVVFGNVLERSALEIWRDPAYRAFRHRAAIGDDGRPEICDTCLRGAGVICTSATTAEAFRDR